MVNLSANFNEHKIREYLCMALTKLILSNKITVIS